MWLLLEVEVPFLCPVDTVPTSLALYFCICFVSLWSTHPDRVESRLLVSSSSVESRRKGFNLPERDPKLQ